MPPALIDYTELAARAAADGRRCVVGALVLDERGRAFVHRRSRERSFLPGGWDLVGGHVEGGETLLGALEREVREETGWRLRGAPQLIHVADWEWKDGRRREFDFLVEVDGDLARPRLEFPKHVECRWIGAGETELLDENRGADNGLVRRLVELALRSARRPELCYPHAAVFLGTGAAARVEALRAEWDPAMAAQIAAHVTVAYPDEVSVLDGLIERAGRVARQTAPFLLRLGQINHYGDPAEGVFVRVEDIERGCVRLRERIVAASTSRFRPHVTIVHPRTTNRGAAAWEALRDVSVAAEFQVDEVAVTAFDGEVWPTVETFRLGG